MDFDQLKQKITKTAEIAENYFREKEALRKDPVSPVPTQSPEKRKNGTPLK
jgi:hypothetical protein